MIWTILWLTPRFSGGTDALSKPSQWPLPERGSRLLTPAFMLEELAVHPLTRGCYPLAMGFYPAAAGHRMQRREHDDNLLIYCVEGGGRLAVGRSRYRVTPGDVVMLPRGVVHGYRADTANPWSIFWVHFAGDDADAFIAHLGYRPERPVLPVGLLPALNVSFQNLLAVQHTGYSSRAFIDAANQLRHLLTQLAIAAHQHQASRPRALDLTSLQQFMQERIDQTLGLDTLAAAANLSRFHFATQYKRLTGYSPMKHFLHMKMEHACTLLDRTALSIKAIAAAVGYTDALYFSRQFRRTLGLSPRAYRASVRQ